MANFMSAPPTIDAKEANGTVEAEANLVGDIRSSSQDDTDGTSSIILPGPSSYIMFHLFPDFNTISVVFRINAFRRNIS